MSAEALSRPLVFLVYRFAVALGAGGFVYEADASTITSIYVRQAATLSAARVR